MRKKLTFVYLGLLPRSIGLDNGLCSSCLYFLHIAQSITSREASSGEFRVNVLDYNSVLLAIVLYPFSLHICVFKAPLNGQWRISIPFRCTSAFLGRLLAANGGSLFLFIAHLRLKEHS